jgi:hypothetical protein
MLESQFCRHRNLSLSEREQTMNHGCLAPLLTKKKRLSVSGTNLYSEFPGRVRRRQLGLGYATAARRPFNH